MAERADRPLLRWTDSLVDVVAAVEAAAGRVAAADPAERASLAHRSRRRAALLSARLDASPLDAETAAAVDAREDAGLPRLPPGAGGPVAPDGAAAEPAGGWASALKLDGLRTCDLAAVEYADLLACADAEPAIAATFFDQPLDALDRLAVEVGRGLVGEDALGRLRRSEQSVSDGAQGRVLYHAVGPGRLPALLEGLGQWLRTTAAGVPTVAVAAIVHERLLEWHPYEAANGRVARAASRVVLRARGLDPEGVAVPEETFAADALGYHAEVAATQRRRGDLSLWVERYGEALATAFEEAAAAVARDGVLGEAPGVEVVADLAPGGELTLPDYARRRGVSPATARIELRRLAAAGLLVREPGTRGLRYRRCEGLVR